MNPIRVEQKLADLAKELERRGQEDLASAVNDVLSDIKAEKPSAALMTTGAAAEALGVRSINTVKNWVKEGRLEGVRRGGRIMITAASVEELRQGPGISEWARFEKEIDEAFDPFMAADEESLPSVIPWTGRKPWEER